MHTMKAAFYKDPTFRYQREYRFAFDINDDHQAICLDIGNIRNISIFEGARSVIGLEQLQSCVTLCPPYPNP